MTYLEAKKYGKTNQEDITTDKVQFWLSSGTMLTAQMLNAEAKELIRQGRAFVISEQAIGQLDNLV